MNAQTGEQTFGTECRQGFGTGEDRQGHERERQQEVRHFRMFRGWLQRRASRLAPLWTHNSRGPVGARLARDLATVARKARSCRKSGRRLLLQTASAAGVAQAATCDGRSEARLVGKEGVSTCRSRW